MKGWLGDARPFDGPFDRLRMSGEGFHPHPNLPPSRGKGEEGGNWIPAFAGMTEGEGGVVVVEVIRFVWLPFFLWWDTKGVFIADWGEIWHSLYCCGENEWGAFTGRGIGFGGASCEVAELVCMFHGEMGIRVGGLWQGGVAVFWGENRPHPPLSRGQALTFSHRGGREKRGHSSLRQAQGRPSPLPSWERG